MPSTPPSPPSYDEHSLRDVGTLLEALPYIREFHGKTVVIKYGGAAMIDAALKEEFARDVVLLKYVGMNPVIVHGGGPEITSYMQRLDLPVQFVDGLRVSDAETVEVAKMVLVGKVNKDIVLLINRHGQPAIGLCGDDGLLFRAKRKTAPSGQDIGFVGAIERVDVDVLTHVAQDYIPVVASVGADREGNSYNINADEAAGAVARALTRVQADVPDRRARVAARSGRSRQRRVRGRRRRGDRSAAERRRRHAAEAPGVRRRDPGRRLVRAHRRRARASLAAARAVHERRLGHEDRARAVSLVELEGLEREYAVPTYVRNPVQFVRGSGVRLWDADGNEYLDFLAGISVLNVGHCHPRVVEAVRDQIGRLSHVSNLYYTEPALQAVGGAVARARSAARCSCATRARRRTRRRSSSRGARGPAGTWSCSKARSTAAPTARCRRLRRRPSRRRSRRSCRASWLSRRTRLRCRPRSTRGPRPCCSSRSRARPASTSSPTTFCRAAREACDRTGAALIFDEIQTGLGRTGTLWAYEQTDVVPDALTSAKALGGGLPIGASITGPRLADTCGPAITARRSPAAQWSRRRRSSRSRSVPTPNCSRACASPATGSRPGSPTLPYVTAVRGRGLMLAIDVNSEVDAPGLARRALLEQRLVVNATGPATIRLEPPLIVSDDELDEAVARLGALAS